MDVLHRLRADPRTSGLRVVIVSADANPNQMNRLLAAGAYAYLTKPLDVARMLALLDNLFARNNRACGLTCWTILLAEARVFVIDDHPSNVALLQAVLTRAGMRRIFTETDSRQVLPRLADVDPDLVVLDLHMPHLDGFAVLAQIRRVRPQRVPAGARPHRRHHRGGQRAGAERGRPGLRHQTVQQQRGRAPRPQLARDPVPLHLAAQLARAAGR